MAKRVGEDYIPPVQEYSVLPPLPPVTQVDIDTYQGPTEESNWVIYGRLLVGAYPSSVNDAVNNQILSSILKLGIKTFVCLQAEYQHEGVREAEWRAGIKLRPYIFDAIRLVDDLPAGFFPGQAKPEGLEFVFFPIVDCAIANDNSVLQLAQDLCGRLLRGESMYVHCWGGHGRTGTVVSIMLGLLYGLAPLDAMRWVQFCHDLRVTPMGVSSPQTEAQRQQVIRVLNALRAKQHHHAGRGLMSPQPMPAAAKAAAAAMASAPQALPSPSQPSPSTPPPAIVAPASPSRAGAAAANSSPGRSLAPPLTPAAQAAQKMQSMSQAVPEPAPKAPEPVANPIVAVAQAAPVPAAAPAPGQPVQQTQPTQAAATSAAPVVKSTTPLASIIASKIRAGSVPTRPGVPTATGPSARILAPTLASAVAANRPGSATAAGSKLKKATPMASPSGKAVRPSTAAGSRPSMGTVAAPSSPPAASLPVQPVVALPRAGQTVTVSPLAELKRPSTAMAGTSQRAGPIVTAAAVAAAIEASLKAAAGGQAATSAAVFTSPRPTIPPAVGVAPTAPVSPVASGPGRTTATSPATSRARVLVKQTVAPTASAKSTAAPAVASGPSSTRPHPAELHTQAYGSGLRPAAASTAPGNAPSQPMPHLSPRPAAQGQATKGEAAEPPGDPARLVRARESGEVIDPRVVSVAPLASSTATVLGLGQLVSQRAGQGAMAHVKSSGYGQASAMASRPSSAATGLRAATSIPRPSSAASPTASPYAAPVRSSKAGPGSPGTVGPSSGSTAGASFASARGSTLASSMSGSVSGPGSPAPGSRLLPKRTTLGTTASASPAAPGRVSALTAGVAAMSIAGSPEAAPSPAYVVPSVVADKPGPPAVPDVTDAPGGPGTPSRPRVRVIVRTQPMGPGQVLSPVGALRPGTAGASAAPLTIPVRPSTAMGRTTPAGPGMDGQAGKAAQQVVASASAAVAAATAAALAAQQRIEKMPVKVSVASVSPKRP